MPSTLPPDVSELLDYTFIQYIRRRRRKSVFRQLVDGYCLFVPINDSISYSIRSRDIGTLSIPSFHCRCSHDEATRHDPLSEQRALWNHHDRNGSAHRIRFFAAKTALCCENVQFTCRRCEDSLFHAAARNGAEGAFHSHHHHFLFLRLYSLFTSCIE